MDRNHGREWRRLQCSMCGRGASGLIPAETIVRALIVCPECIEANRVTFPPDDQGDDDGNR